MDVGGKTVIDVSVGSETVRGIAKDPFGLMCLCFYGGENICSDFEDAVYESDGAVVGGAVGVRFVGLVDELSGAGAPFHGGVAMLGHDFNEVEYDVMRGLP